LPIRFSPSQSQNLEPLDRELGALEDYLAVQRIRFGADLECSIECDIAARSLLVPPMLIQPLLENAFKYGPLTSAMPLRVEVKAVVVREGEECSLLISVANTGRWRPEQRKEPEQPGGLQFLGTGLTNLRKRLVLLLGAGSTLQIKKEPAWVKVEIRVPIQDVATIEKQAIEAT
jgi:LytS/YehU family sensor histidine kinase